MLRSSYILHNSQSIGQNPPKKERKSELATSPPPSRGPKRGHICYVTRVFSGVPNGQRGEKIRSGSLGPAFSGA